MSSTRWDAMRTSSTAQQLSHSGQSSIDIDEVTSGMQNVPDDTTCQRVPTRLGVLDVSELPRKPSKIQTNIFEAGMRTPFEAGLPDSATGAQGSATIASSSGLRSTTPKSAKAPLSPFGSTYSPGGTLRSPFQVLPDFSSSSLSSLNMDRDSPDFPSPITDIASPAERQEHDVHQIDLSDRETEAEELPEHTQLPQNLEPVVDLRPSASAGKNNHETQELGSPNLVGISTPPLPGIDRGRLSNKATGASSTATVTTADLQKPLTSGTPERSVGSNGGAPVMRSSSHNMPSTTRRWGDNVASTPQTAGLYSYQNQFAYSPATALHSHSMQGLHPMSPGLIMQNPSLAGPASAFAHMSASTPGAFATHSSFGPSTATSHLHPFGMPSDTRSAYSNPGIATMPAVPRAASAHNILSTAASSIPGLPAQTASGMHQSALHTHQQSQGVNLGQAQHMVNTTLSFPVGVLRRANECKQAVRFLALHGPSHKLVAITGNVGLGMFSCYAPPASASTAYRPAVARSASMRLESRGLGLPMFSMRSHASSNATPPFDASSGEAASQLHLPAHNSSQLHGASSGTIHLQHSYGGLAHQRTMSDNGFLHSSAAASTQQPGMRPVAVMDVHFTPLLPGATDAFTPENNAARNLIPAAITAMTTSSGAGAHIVWTGHEDGTLRVWDARSRNALVWVGKVPRGAAVTALCAADDAARGTSGEGHVVWLCDATGCTGALAWKGNAPQQGQQGGNAAQAAGGAATDHGRLSNGGAFGFKGIAEEGVAPVGHGVAQAGPVTWVHEVRAVIPGAGLFASDSMNGYPPVSDEVQHPRLASIMSGSSFTRPPKPTWKTIMESCAKPVNVTTPPASTDCSPTQGTSARQFASKYTTMVGNRSSKSKAVLKTLSRTFSPRREKQVVRLHNTSSKHMLAKHAIVALATQGMALYILQAPSHSVLQSADFSMYGSCTSLSYIRWQLPGSTSSGALSKDAGALPMYRSGDSSSGYSSTSSAPGLPLNRGVRTVSNTAGWKLLTAHDKATVLVWDLSNSRCEILCSIRGDGLASITCLCVQHTLDMMITSHADGKIALWPTPTPNLIQIEGASSSSDPPPVVPRRTVKPNLPVIHSTSRESQEVAEVLAAINGTAPTRDLGSLFSWKSSSKRRTHTQQAQHSSTTSAGNAAQDGTVPAVREVPAWKVRTWTQQVHSSCVAALAVAGTTAVTGSIAGGIKAWDLLDLGRKAIASGLMLTSLHLLPTGHPTAPLGAPQQSQPMPSTAAQPHQPTLSTGTMASTAGAALGAGHHMSQGINTPQHVAAGAQAHVSSHMSAGHSHPSQSQALQAGSVGPMVSMGSVNLPHSSSDTAFYSVFGNASGPRPVLPRASSSMSLHNRSRSIANDMPMLNQLAVNAPPPNRGMTGSARAGMPAPAGNMVPGTAPASSAATNLFRSHTLLDTRNSNNGRLIQHVRSPSATSLPGASPLGMSSSTARTPSTAAAPARRSTPGWLNMSPPSKPGFVSGAAGTPNPTPAVPVHPMMAARTTSDVGVHAGLHNRTGPMRADEMAHGRQVISSPGAGYGLDRSDRQNSSPSALPVPAILAAARRAASPPMARAPTAIPDHLPVISGSPLPASVRIPGKAPASAPPEITSPNAVFFNNDRQLPAPVTVSPFAAANQDADEGHQSEPNNVANHHVSSQGNAAQIRKRSLDSSHAVRHETNSSEVGECSLSMYSILPSLRPRSMMLPADLVCGGSSSAQRPDTPHLPSDPQLVHPSPPTTTSNTHASPSEQQPQPVYVAGGKLQDVISAGSASSNPVSSPIVRRFSGHGLSMSDMSVVARDVTQSQPKHKPIARDVSFTHLDTNGTYVQHTQQLTYTDVQNEEMVQATPGQPKQRPTAASDVGSGCSSSSSSSSSHARAVQRCHASVATASDHSMHTTSNPMYKRDSLEGMHMDSESFTHSGPVSQRVSLHGKESCSTGPTTSNTSTRIGNAHSVGSSVDRAIPHAATHSTLRGEGVAAGAASVQIAERAPHPHYSMHQPLPGSGQYEVSPASFNSLIGPGHSVTAMISNTATASRRVSDPQTGLEPIPVLAPVHGERSRLELYPPTAAVQEDPGSREILQAGTAPHREHYEVVSEMQRVTHGPPSPWHTGSAQVQTPTGTGSPWHINHSHFGQPPMQTNAARSVQAWGPLLEAGNTQQDQQQRHAGLAATSSLQLDPTYSESQHVGARHTRTRSYNGVALDVISNHLQSPSHGPSAFDQLRSHQHMQSSPEFLFSQLGYEQSPANAGSWHAAAPAAYDTQDLEQWWGADRRNSYDCVSVSHESVAGAAVCSGPDDMASGTATYAELLNLHQHQQLQQHEFMLQQRMQQQEQQLQLAFTGSMLAQGMMLQQQQMATAAQMAAMGGMLPPVGHVPGLFPLGMPPMNWFDPSSFTGVAPPVASPFPNPMWWMPPFGMPSMLQHNYLAQQQQQQQSTSTLQQRPSLLPPPPDAANQGPSHQSIGGAASKASSAESQTTSGDSLEPKPKRAVASAVPQSGAGQDARSPNNTSAAAATGQVLDSASAAAAGTSSTPPTPPVSRRTTRGQVLDMDNPLSAFSDKFVKADDVKLVEEVGKGAEGTVWRGRWHHTDVAVKEMHHKTTQFNRLATLARDMHKGKAESADVFDAVIKEVQTLADVSQHPNIVRFIGLCMEPPRIITEYYPLGSLYQMLSQARDGNEGVQRSLSWPRRLLMLHNIAAGMGYLHSRSYVHGDLRTPNIFVASDGMAKIGDFGFAQIIGDSDDKVSNRTTNPRWLAPEVLRSGKSSKASDVFSFAIIMWEMLTFQVPYNDYMSVQVTIQHNNDGFRPEIPADNKLPVSKQVNTEPYKALMRECWDQDAGKRPSFAEIASRLSALLHWQARLAGQIRSNSGNGGATSSSGSGTATSGLTAALTKRSKARSPAGDRESRHAGRAARRDQHTDHFDQYVAAWKGSRQAQATASQDLDGRDKDATSQSSSIRRAGSQKHMPLAAPPTGSDRIASPQSRHSAASSTMATPATGNGPHAAQRMRRDSNPALSTSFGIRTAQSLHARVLRSIAQAASGAVREHDGSDGYTDMSTTRGPLSGRMMPHMDDSPPFLVAPISPHMNSLNGFSARNDTGMDNLHRSYSIRDHEAAYVAPAMPPLALTNSVTPDASAWLTHVMGAYLAANGATPAESVTSGTNTPLGEYAGGSSPRDSMGPRVGVANGRSGPSSRRASTPLGTSPVSAWVVMHSARASLARSSSRQGAASSSRSRLGSGDINEHVGAGVVHSSPSSPRSRRNSYAMFTNSGPGGVPRIHAHQNTARSSFDLPSSARSFIGQHAAGPYLHHPAYHHAHQSQPVSPREQQGVPGARTESVLSSGTDRSGRIMLPYPPHPSSTSTFENECYQSKEDASSHRSSTEHEKGTDDCIGSASYSANCGDQNIAGAARSGQSSPTPAPRGARSRSTSPRDLKTAMATSQCDSDAAYAAAGSAPAANMSTSPHGSSSIFMAPSSRTSSTSSSASLPSPQGLLLPASSSSGLTSAGGDHSNMASPRWSTLPSVPEHPNSGSISSVLSIASLAATASGSDLEGFGKSIVRLMPAPTALPSHLRRSSAATDSLHSSPSVQVKSTTCSPVVTMPSFGASSDAIACAARLSDDGVAAVPMMVNTGVCSAAEQAEHDERRETVQSSVVFQPVIQ